MTKKVEGESYLGFKIVKVLYNMFKIKSAGRGSVPIGLRGSYTTAVDAKIAIDLAKRADNKSEE